MSETKRGFTFTVNPKDKEYFKELGVQFLVSLKASGWTPLDNPRLGKFVYIILTAMGVPAEAFTSGPYVDPAFLLVQKEFDAHVLEEFGPEFLSEYKKNFSEEYEGWLRMVFDSTIDNISDEVEEFVEEIKEDFIGPCSDDGPEMEVV